MQGVGWGIIADGLCMCDAARPACLHTMSAGARDLRYEACCDARMWGATSDGVTGLHAGGWGEGIIADGLACVIHSPAVSIHPCNSRPFC